MNAQNGFLTHRGVRRDGLGLCSCESMSLNWGARLGYSAPARLKADNSRHLRAGLAKNANCQPDKSRQFPTTVPTIPDMNRGAWESSFVVGRLSVPHCVKHAQKRPNRVTKHPAHPTLAMQCRKKYSKVLKSSHDKSEVGRSSRTLSKVLKSTQIVSRWLGGGNPSHWSFQVCEHG